MMELYIELNQRHELGARQHIFLVWLLARKKQTYFLKVGEIVIALSAKIYLF